LNDPTVRAPRLPAFDPATASAEQQAVLGEILSGPRGNLDGPFLAWIASPAFAQHAQRLGAFCRYETGLSKRLSELAILVTAARWHAQAEWQIHYPIAIDAGVSPAIAEALRAGEPPRFDDEDDELIFAFATELYENRRVSDRTFEAALSRFGRTTTVNLVGLLGYYTLVAMTLNVFEVTMPDRGSPPFSE